MDRSYWCELSDSNLAESHREFARWHPEGEILERQGILLTRGASRYPGVNFVMRTGHASDPAQVVQRATAFFRPRAEGFAIRTRAHIDGDLSEYCDARDLFLAGENTGLIRRTLIPSPDPRPNMKARLAEDAKAVEALAEVATAAFATIGLPEATAREIFRHPRHMLGPHLIPMVAYAEGRAAATAIGLLSHGIAGLYWVGTAPWARQRGLARLVTTAVHNEALDRGARAVVLQASREHEPFYRSLGFEVLTRYPWYFAGHLPAR